MLELIIYFLALLNPFALFIYTLPLKKALGMRKYANVLMRASIISLVIFAFFAVAGDAFFTRVLKIQFDSFRIFGGLVLVAFSLSFILQGKDSMITTRGELSKLAAQVALPFMVGAGTITLSIVLGSRLGPVGSVVALFIVMLIVVISVLLLALLRQALKRRMQEVLDKNLEIWLRINGFIIGAFGVDLIVTGIKNMMG